MTAYAERESNSFESGAAQLLLEADGVREGCTRKSAVALARRGLTMR
jgi:hypothetical protein